MRSYLSGILKIAAFILAAIAILATLPRFSPVLFPRVQEPSSTYDCDDDTLQMYREFERLGIESTPIIGNLNMSGEAYMECDHVWLLVKSGDKEIAYDWGTPRFDRQHYEGYTISLDYLLYAVNQDKKGDDTLASTEH
jgi:hypothetical protein